MEPREYRIIQEGYTDVRARLLVGGGVSISQDEEGICLERDGIKALKAILEKFIAKRPVVAYLVKNGDTYLSVTGAETTKSGACRWAPEQRALAELFTHGRAGARVVKLVKKNV